MAAELEEQKYFGIIFYILYIIILYIGLYSIWSEMLYNDNKVIINSNS
jgi:hypothetical protein